MPNIDHIILKVNDLDSTLDFYTRVMGFAAEGRDGPFAVLRVDGNFTVHVAEWGTSGNEHYAFAVSRPEFDTILGRLKKESIPFGDAFDTVGTNVGPGNELGARGMAPTVYFFDPSHHLLEIRTYE